MQRQAPRKALDMTQHQVEARSDGHITRVDVSRVESGYNEASTSRMRAGFAYAFGLTQDVMSAYIEGRISLENALASRSHPVAQSPTASAHSTKTVEGIGALAGVIAMLAQYNIEGVSYPELALCVAYHRGRWSHPAMAVAASGYYGDDDVPAADWEHRLDAIETMLQSGPAHPKAKKLRPA